MVSLSPLFIDKVSMTLPVPDEDVQQSIYAHLERRAQADEITLILFSEVLKNYQYAWKVPVASNRTTALVQILPRRANQNFLRLEFNPGSSGAAMGAIGDLLSPCIPDFAGRLEAARYTRLDLAVDLWGANIEDIFVVHRTHPLQSKTFTQTGRLTGIQLGSPHSDRSAVVYDKHHELRVKQHRFLRGQRTRFEIRCRDLGNLADVMTMPNPFNAFSLSYYDTDGPQRGPTGDIQRLFLDSCKPRGAQAAIGSISDKALRAEMRKWLHVDMRPIWWDPVTIWSNLNNSVIRALNAH